MNIKLHSYLGLFLVVALSLTACQAKSTESPRGWNIPQSQFLSMLERKSGLISYVGDDGNIYVVNQTGEKPLQITKDAKLKQNDLRRYYYPTWSPDSNSLAFYAIGVKNDTDFSSSIFSVGSDGKNLVEAYTSKTRLPSYLSWSPNSKKISFITGSEGSNSLTLSVVAATGGAAQTADVGAPYYWDWQPDSSGVLIHTGGATSQNKAARLSFLNITDSVSEDRLNLSPSFFQSPDYSPDGKQILLATEKDGKRAVVLTDRAGNVLKTLDNTLAGATAFSWSPDGKKVAYIAAPQIRLPTQGKLNFFDVAKDSKVVADQDKVVAFFWSPDSKQVAYFVVVEEKIPTPTPKPGAEPSTDPAQTQLYTKLYVTDVTSGKSTLLARYVPTEDFFSMLPYFDQYSRSGTIWSPDGQYLVVAAQMGQNNQGIFVVPASGVTEPRFLQAGSMAFWSWK